MVGHAGNVIADHAMARLLLRHPGVILRHAVGMFHEETEQGVEGGHRLVALFGNRGMGIELRVEEALQRGAFRGDLRRKCREALRLAANILDGLRAARLDPRARIFDQIGRQAIDHLLAGLR